MRARVLSHLRRVLIVGLPAVLIWVARMQFGTGSADVWLDAFLVIMGIGYVALFMIRERAILPVFATLLTGLLMGFARISGPTAGTVAGLVWVVTALAMLEDWRASALAVTAIAAVVVGKGLAAWQGIPVLLDSHIAVPLSLYARMCLAFMMVLALTVLMMREVRRGLTKALLELDARTAAEDAERRAREAAEEQLAKAERMGLAGRLASGIAHDVNNALTVITASTEMLRRSKSETERERLVAEIMTATETAGQTIATIAAFGRARVAQPSVIRASEAVQAFASTARRILPLGVHLKVECDSDAAICIDRAGFNQALLNLALNARDAMPEGGTLRFRVTFWDGGRVVVEVSDTGTGMSQETLAHVFEPFFTTKEEGRGTGLGLAMVRRTIEGAGGTVEVESHPGQGTTFRIVLPAAGDGGAQSWRGEGQAVLPASRP